MPIPVLAYWIALALSGALLALSMKSCTNAVREALPDTPALQAAATMGTAALLCAGIALLTAVWK